MTAPARPFRIRARVHMVAGSLGRLRPGDVVTVTHGAYLRSINSTGQSWLDQLDPADQVDRWGVVRVEVVPDSEVA